MDFSIIYSIDCPRYVCKASSPRIQQSIAKFNPPKTQRRLWQMTEGDNQYDYGYLEGRWEKGKHRKWCAVLNREQFQEFLDHTYLTCENVRTLGSLGAPGCGLGISPAFSFNGRGEEDAILNAYVTPLADRQGVVEFLREVAEEKEYEPDIPSVLVDAEGQLYLWDDVAGANWDRVERILLDAFCEKWG